MSEISTKPYFIRALHEWCTDSGHTPHIVVMVDSRARVPRAFVRDGQITLDIGNLATKSLVLGNEFIEFQARFGGKTENISVPVYSVTAIYSKETGAGMGFEVEAATSETPDDSPSPSATPVDSDKEEKPKRPHLKVVK